MAWVLAEQIEVATTLHTAGFLRDDDEQGSVARLRAWAEVNASNPTAQWVLQRLRLGPVVEPILWFACWARSGFARVTMGHRLAAALIATQAPADALEELPAPWPAYLIEVPHGLFEARDLMLPGTPRVSFDLIMVRHTPDGMIRIGVRPREGAVTLMRGPLGWEEFVTDDFDTVQAMGGLYGSADDLHHRVLTCAARLTAGVELELSDPRAVRS
ncbi:MAG: hypothetical protein JNL79_36190, partial [Myxococcales bacterium]|nr:hypothetical protein [Myxococcales bacterium]